MYGNVDFFRCELMKNLCEFSSCTALGHGGGVRKFTHLQKSASASSYIAYIIYIMRTRKLFPMHCKENPIYVFLFCELRSLSVGIGETEQQSSIVEITVSFPGIYKWEPDIYIGFSPSLHLQCAISYKFPLYLTERAILMLWSELLNVSGRQQHNHR